MPLPGHQVPSNNTPNPKPRCTQEAEIVKQIAADAMKRLKEETTDDDSETGYDPCRP